MSAYETLNPSQFGLFYDHVDDHNIGVDDDPYFHGTSPKAAEGISQHGFSLAQQANGRSGGDGVYLHDHERQTRQYGPTTVAATLAPHLRIHGNPYNDEQAINMASQYKEEEGGEIFDHMPHVLHQFGYHGHRDPDDKSTLVYDPKNVHYLTHHTPPPRDANRPVEDTWHGDGK